MTLSPATATIAEGGAQHFTITREPFSAPQVLTVQLAYPAAPGAIPRAVHTADFTAPLSVTFAAASPTATFTVSALPDALLEGFERTDVALLPAAPGDIFYFLGARHSATLTISDETVQVVSVSAGPSFAENGASFVRFERVPAPVNPLPLTVLASFTGLAERFLDYTVTPSALAFAGTDAFFEVTLTGVVDALVEGPEPIDVTLLPSPLYDIGVGEATLSLLDLNAFQVSLTQDRNFIAEQIVNDAIILVTRSIPANPLSTTVTLAVGGAAIWGTDYNTTIPALAASTATTATVLFTDHANSVAVYVTAIEDDRVEGPEELVWSIVPDPAQFQLQGQTEATISILDGTPTIISVVASVSEASEGGAPFTLTFRRSPEPQNPLTLTVPYVLTGTAVYGADYEFEGGAVIGSVTFVDFQTEVAVAVEVLNDDEVEGIEELSVMLIAAPTDVFYVLDPLQSTATVTVFDDDVFTLSIEVTPSQVLEEDAATTTAVFSITRRPAPQLSAPYEVPLSWSGDAVLSADYLVLAGAVQRSGQWYAEFLSAEATASVFIGFVDDQALEADEHVTLSLAEPTSPAYVVDPAKQSATVTITDGDLCGLDGAPCDTFDQCTTDGQCVSDVCVGVPVDCEDGDPCTINSCDPRAGCLAMRIADESVGCSNQMTAGMNQVDDDPMEYELKPLSPDDFRNPFEDENQQYDLNGDFQMMQQVMNVTVVRNQANNVQDPNNQVLNNSGISLVVSLFGVAAMSVALCAGCCIAIVARRNVIDEKKRLEEQLEEVDEEDGEHWMSG